MHADIQGALDQINTSYKAFTHKGKKMTKEQVKMVLEYGSKKGYKYTSELSDQMVDEVLNKSETKDADSKQLNINSTPDNITHNEGLCPYDKENNCACTTVCEWSKNMPNPYKPKSSEPGLKNGDVNIDVPFHPKKYKEETMFMGIIRNFNLCSGAMENDFNVNDFNTDYVDSVIDEQCMISISLHG